MTQWAFGITLDNEELKTVRAALDDYFEVCRREVRKGETVPFLAHRSSLRRFLRALPRRTKLSSPPTVSDQATFYVWDSEHFSLEAAFANYLDRCEREIANGITVPFDANRAAIERIRARMLDESWRALLYAEAKMRPRRGDE